ncbi:conserved hypothetical protein [Hyella patelloides LEGE 07179]|uniref:Uncharacterized protein n=1 Tax=Hyella patelloides LEGE 07179 TaxID=945734 RepID=A0A563W3G8_9CYAN|nr:hypothetical protein [Hyella patelloides]VEP18205.1 conserved hypothetical protein [Hyella patelloides LEGE 07179]
MQLSKPEYSGASSSIHNTVTTLHSYFRDMQSYYKAFKGKVLSELEEAENELQIKELKETLQDINKRINYFHVLNNSISTVDVVLHTEAMIQEFIPKEKK